MTEHERSQSDADASENRLSPMVAVSARVADSCTKRSLAKRLLVLGGNLLLLYHVLAIAIAPSSIAPSSKLQRDSWLAVGPYLEVLFLNHGWHFFAPDPGASTLLEYVGTTPNGQTVKGQIPDKSQLKPRLMYHRHFMLTESIPRVADSDADVRAGYYQALADGVGQLTGAETVELTRVTHRLSTMPAIRAGFPLTDPAQYDREPMGTFSCQR